MTTRRDVLTLAATALASAALTDAPPTTDELRILAMTATPAKVWEGREEEYGQTRIVKPGTPTMHIIDDLERRGWIVCIPTGGDGGRA